MKRIIALLLILTMILSFAACAGKAGNSTEKENKQETISISIFAGGIPKNSPTGTGIEAMIAEIDKNSSGSIKATAYYDTELGDASSMVQGMVQGTIDIGVSGDAYYSGLVPMIQVFELPFMFETIDQARAAVDGPAKDVIFKELEAQGIIGLAFWENGMRQLTNSVKPIQNLDDLQGIKIRTTPATMQIEAWKALGTLPTSIDIGELYTALQVGTVDAQENPFAEIEYKKFYEVQPYLTVTNHVYTPFLMGLSKKTADKMTPEQLQIVKDAALVGQQVQRDAAAAAQETAKQNMLDYGIEIVEDADLTAFRERAMTVYSIFTDTCGQEIVDIVKGTK